MAQMILLLLLTECWQDWCKRMKRSVYSVGQVNSYIKNMFTQDFLLKMVCIKGEVSNCKYHSSGHIYFTLKDKDGAINAIMFAGNRKGLNFLMKEGDKVLVTGSVEVYERDGKYQIYAKEITLDGEGDLFLKYEALKQELEEMGMFASEYKKPIPKFATKIGIVTAPTGAAIQDIRNISTRRNPYVQLILYPALVQGDGAKQSIIQGINALDILGVDIIIVGRGGGSLEDLWAFNEETVARAIFECATPVISAVGHETDTTIADFVADLRAPTPSAAAELAIFDMQQYFDHIDTLKNRLNRQTYNKLELTKSKLKLYYLQLKVKNPANQINSNKQYLLVLEDKLHQKMNQKLQDKKHKLILLAKNLDGLSPTKKLSQGYSYVSDDDGKAVRDIAQVTIGENVNIHVLNGRMKAKIISKE